MNCRECQLEIDASANCQLSSAEGRRHLALCGACRNFQRERAALKMLVGELARVESPTDFDFRLRARLAAERSAERSDQWEWLQFAPPTAWLSLAGCMALTLTVGLYLQQAKSPAVTRSSGGVVAAPEPTLAVVANAGADQASVSGRAGGQTLQPQAVDLNKDVSAAFSRRGVRRASSALKRLPAVASPSSEGSLDTGSLGAPAAFAATATSFDKNARQAIPLQMISSSRPMQVELRDSQGAKRVLTVAPVSFGSKDAIGQSGIVRQATISSDQGVW